MVFALESFVMAFRGTKIADVQGPKLVGGFMSDVDITTVVRSFARFDRAGVYSVEGAFGVLLKHVRCLENLLTDAASISEFRHAGFPRHPTRWAKLRWLRWIFKD